MTEKVEFTEEQQKFVDDLVGRTRVEVRDKTTRDHKTELETQRNEAEEAKLVENQEYKELAEQRGAQVAELETYREQVGTYQEVMQGVLDSELETLGDAARQAVESLPGDVTVKLNWLSKNKALFEITGDGVGSSDSGKKTTRKDDRSQIVF